MTAAQRLAARRRRQAGYTLIELIVASAIGLVVMGALTSIVLTSVLGDNAATGRVEASAQIRSFQLTAYDDFALSRPPAVSGCGTKASPCTTQAMTLSGTRMPNEIAGTALPYSVTYAWDPSLETITRTVGGGTQVAASDVSSYSWYIDSTEANPVVVVTLTVTVADYNTTYVESQTLLFYPRVNAP